MPDEGIFVEGLPLGVKIKFAVMMVSMFTLIINHNLPVFSSMLDYPYRDFITLAFLLVFVVFSIGSVVTESIVVGLAIFIIMSNVWDLSVQDISELRKGVLVGSFAILAVALTFGKISFWNLTKIIKGQLGNG